MKKRAKYVFFGLVIGLIISLIISIAQSSIDARVAGVSLWILFIGALTVVIFEIVPVAIFRTGYYKWKKGRYIDWGQIKSKILYYLIGLIAGSIIGFEAVWARSIDLKQGGVALWTFIIVGIFIILLQLIPAIILFVSLVGTWTKIMHDKIPVVKENNPVAATETAEEEVKT